MPTYSHRQYAWAAATVVTSLTSAAYLDNHVSNELVWGGTVCETTSGVLTCSGYPPTGLMLLFFLSGAAAMLVSSLMLDDPPEAYT